MDILKLLESIEEFLYRVSLWIVLVPRTLWFVLRHPGNIHPYIVAELEKDAEKRFEQLVSPATLFVIAALIPHMMLLDFLNTIPASRVASESLWVSFMRAPWTTRLVVVSILGLSAPLGFSLRGLKSHRVTLTRSNLRLPFMVHCYCFTPVYIALLPIVYFALRYDSTPAGFDEGLVETTIVLIVTWVAFAESAVLAKLHAISRIRAVVRALGYSLYVFFFFFVLELLVLTLFHGLAVWRT